MAEDILQRQILAQIAEGPVTIEDIQRGHAWTYHYVVLILGKMLVEGLVIKEGSFYKSPTTPIGQDGID